MQELWSRGTGQSDKGIRGCLGRDSEDPWYRFPIISMMFRMDPEL